MEKLQDPRLPERARNGEARSLRGCGARPVSSAASKMGDYAEIFGGFALSCSIPVLVLPEAMEGYGEQLVESRSLNYAEIFGDHDSGSFSLCYEELLCMDNGINENDRRFEEQINGGQVVTGASLMHSAVPIGDHNIFSKVNQTSSSLDLNLDTKQLDFFGKTSQQSTEDEVKSTKNKVKSTEDEVKSTIGSSAPQSYNEPYFEDETFFSTRFVEVATPKEFASDDHVLHGYIEEREDGKQRETFNRCFVSATVDHSEKDPKPLKHSTPEGNAENLKQHSRSSSYHSASSGDVPFSDYSFLSISDINHNTQPLQVPPPSRAPPKYNMKQESSKSESLKSSDTTSDIELIPEPYKSYHAPNIGGPRTRHALKETMKTNSPVYLNVEVDASSAAAASAAAMIEAMEQAQASLKNAKELMERKGVCTQSERRKDPHDFGVCNGQSVNFSRRSRHKTKAKVVPKLVERVNSVFSEDPGEPMHGKESRFNLLWNEKERSHEWKIDKQFYELVSNERLLGSKIINDDKYISNEATKLARQLNSYQFFPEKKVCGKQRKMFSQSNIESEKQNQYRISEKTLYTGGELQLQDGNSKKSKFGSTIDDEDKQKVGPVHQVCDDAKLKVEDTIIQLDMKGSKLKECQDSHTSVENEKSEDDNKESKANGRNDSSFIDDDSKHEEFSGEPVGKILGKSKESDGIHGISLVSEFVPLSTYEMAYSRKMCNSTVTSDVTVNKKIEAKLSSLENANEVEVGTEYRTSFSIENETNLENLREKRQPGMLKKTRKTSVLSYGEGKDSELEDINNTFEKDISGSLSDTDKTIDEKKRKYEIRDKLNMPNRSEVKVSNLFVQPNFFENAKALNYQQNVDEKNVYELPQKFENYVDMLIADGEGREGEKHHVGNVQAAVVLENKIKGLSAGHHFLQRNRGQDYEAAYLANTLDKKSNILSPSVDASGSSLKQTDKHIHDESKGANYIRKEVSDRERTEVVQKSMLEEERAREREKDKIAVEIACGESCDKVFAEVRERSEKIVFERVAADSQNKPIAEHRDITEKSSAKAFEKSEKIANEAKLRAERAAVERATAEARERALERALAKQASLESKTQAENLVTVSKDKTWKNDASENIVCSGGKVTDISPKTNSNVYDTSIHIKSQSAAGEGESPLRCKARQERNQRIVERAANALAEKNVRDLIAQREQAERNRLAESLDAEVRRWSTGKEGNLRALLSTLQYILGQDSGWQPIPLAAVITAAGVRKAYRKATLYVHPDKLQQRGASIQHKYICEKIFDLLKDAWNRFDS